jgi:hypothetical protein
MIQARRPPRLRRCTRYLMQFQERRTVLSAQDGCPRSALDVPEAQYSFIEAQRTIKIGDA